jgi:hypothetical protein
VARTRGPACRPLDVLVGPEGNAVALQHRRAETAATPSGTAVNDTVSAGPVDHIHVIAAPDGSTEKSR